MKKILSILVFATLFSAGTVSAQETYSDWYNYATGEHVAMTSAPAQEEMKQFIPQIQAAQGLYETYLAMGKDHVEAAALVLEASLGIK